MILARSVTAPAIQYATDATLAIVAATLVIVPVFLVTAASLVTLASLATVSVRVASNLMRQSPVTDVTLL